MKSTVRFSRPVALAFFLWSPPVLCAQGAPPLFGPADLSLGGIFAETDSGAVRHRFGTPDSILVEDDRLLTWVYPRFSVLFFSTDHVVGVGTRDSSITTPRGLRVGDSVARLRQLYGEPREVYERVWEYRDPNPREQRVLRITLRQGRVGEIYVGLTRFVRHPSKPPGWGENPHPYPTPTMAELSPLGWAGFLLIPLACDAVLLILIFRFPWRWAAQALLITSVVDWGVTLLLFGGLWMFSDKFLGFVYFTVGTPLKAVMISVLMVVQRGRSGTAGRIVAGLARCSGWALLSGVLGWFSTLMYFGLLDHLNLVWR